MKPACWFARSIVLVALLMATTGRAADAPVVDIGLAREDITPAFPVRMTGYGNRLTEAEGAEQQLWAKAMAIGNDAQLPVVVITVDNLGIPAAITETVAERLTKKVGLRLEALAICASHTHSAPSLRGMAGLILNDVTPEHQQHIDQYTTELTDALERVALAAMKARQPALLSWSEGRVGFASNRRVVENGRCSKFGVSPFGMVDHSLPMLTITAPDGQVRAVLVNYACHCTTLGGNFNKYCGDWAGFAQAAIERENPGVQAMISIGCGADSNPEPRNELTMAVQHGDAVAKEVQRLLKVKQLPLGPVTKTVSGRLDLPFDTLPSRAEYEQRASQKGPISKHAKAQLARLDSGKQLPTSIPFRVQTWNFGDELAMAFLPGEVTVDYALRLKRECDGRKLWITAYANDEPCYIASKRVLGEGGYEVDSSMYYYDWPTHFAASIEDQIVNAVCAMLPKPFQEVRDSPAVKWKKDVDKLVAAAEQDPPTGKIVFIGSSSIRRWDVKKSFPNLPVVNHGFGGSTYRDALYFVDRLITNYKPATVVIYSGDNDIGYGKSAEQTASDAVYTIRAIRQKLPDTRIVVLNIKPSLKRWGMYAVQQRANNMIEYYIKTSGDRKTFFVDTGSTLLGSDGQPNPACFVEDRLHMTNYGYELWTAKLRPYLLDESTSAAVK